ncbi:hypothetical protein [Nitrososphaera sp. AFS]|uniref:hypothetical protein n=1 Tax=Nitrososphaera sp. AFS TaxID=2301191 RepID=UPI0013923626|nr:hypothetical protein [Nitrososphaera sp. AFS]NAL78397.1 hypothetical protein [Nitrososphaera sp. AFS]
MAQYEAIIFDFLTRFGNIAPMKVLWAKTSSLWLSCLVMEKIGTLTTAASIRGCDKSAVGVPIVPELTE